MALVGCEEFSELFESVAGFQRVFPRDWSTIADRHVPRRGLREINRFGHFPLLQKISPAKKIDDSTIDHVFAAESSVHGAMSPIARLQKNRERLHEKWVKDKNLGAGDLRDYCETLAGISQHRRDSGFVNLVDHVRAHRTIMSVLGRLVDYVGLFERDLYFVTLALMHRAGLRPDKLFDEEGQRYLFNGQIIFALRELA